MTDIILSRKQHSLKYAADRIIPDTLLEYPSFTTAKTYDKI